MHLQTRFSPFALYTDSIILALRSLLSVQSRHDLFWTTLSTRGSGLHRFSAVHEQTPNAHEQLLRLLS